MKIRQLLQELSAPMDKQAFTDRSKWAAAAASASGQSADSLKDVVKVGEEFVARWHGSTNTGWVQKKAVSESLTHDQEFQFRAWQKECREIDSDCQFAGTKGIGMQAVNWNSSHNRVVGDWDGRTMKGVAYPVTETQMTSDDYRDIGTDNQPYPYQRGFDLGISKKGQVDMSACPYDQGSIEADMFEQGLQDAAQQFIDPRLKQAQQDHDDLPQNPQTQAGYAALDDARQNVKKFSTFMQR